MTPLFIFFFQGVQVPAETWTEIDPVTTSYTPQAPASGTWAAVSPNSATWTPQIPAAGSYTPVAPVSTDWS